MRFFRFLKRPLFWVIVIIIGIALVITAHVLAPPPPPQYLTDSVKEENLVKSVMATGQLYASEMVQVGAQASGQIKAIKVHLGQHVKKGQVIAVIDSENQTNALDINQARLQSAQAQLKAAQTHLTVVTEQLSRLKRLLAQGGVSQDQVDRAADAQAQAELALAQSKAQITQLELAITQNKTELAHTLVTSPIDGVVVSIWVNAGQTVTAINQVPTIAQVADLSTMLNRFRINEADVNEVQPSQPIEVSTFSPGIPAVSTKVQSVDPGLTYLTQGRFTNRTDTVNQAIYYYGRALVPNPKNQYRIGMTTQNRIIIAQEKGLTVPNQAIQYNQKGQPIVYVLDRQTNKPKAVEVQLGLSNGIRIVVTHTKLKAGELVITGTSYAGAGQ